MAIPINLSISPFFSKIKIKKKRKKKIVGTITLTFYNYGIKMWFLVLLFEIVSYKMRNVMYHTSISQISTKEFET
jgi:hypothetical protein